MTMFPLRISRAVSTLETSHTPETPFTLEAPLHAHVLTQGGALQVTLNEYQVKRANHLCKINGLEKQARSVQGDFMKLSSIFPKVCCACTFMRYKHGGRWKAFTLSGAMRGAKRGRIC
jgi:hypothetical protein